MSTYSFGSNLRKGKSLHMFLPLLSVVLIVLQFVLPSVASASSSGGGYTFGKSQPLDEASVSVVRLVAKYTPPLLSKDCSPTTVTGLGTLVGSWSTTQGSNDISNWVLTDGSLVNPDGIQCGTSKTVKAQLSNIAIYVNTAYTNAAGLLLKTIDCQTSPEAGLLCSDVPTTDTIACQVTPCENGVTLVPFHLFAPAYQPFMDLATVDQPPLSGVSLSGVGGALPTSPDQPMQFLTPTLATVGDPKNEPGMPLINSTGQLLDVSTKQGDTGGAIRDFVNTKLAPIQPTQLHDGWNTGVMDFYTNNIIGAQMAFQKASTPNRQFKAPTGFMALPQFQGVSGKPSSGGHPAPTPTPTKTASSNGQPVNLFGLQIPYWLLLPLIIVGVVLVVLLLALVSFLFIRRQRAQAQRRRELAKFDADRRAAAQKAAKDAERIAEQERKQKQQAQQGAPMAKQTVALATPGSPDLRCPNCKNPVKPTDNVCPTCRMPLTFSASGMNVRLAQPLGGAPAQPPAGISQQSPVMQPQPQAGMPVQSPPPGLVPTSAIPDQPTVQMSPSLSRGPYDMDPTAPLNHAQASNGPSAPVVPPDQFRNPNSRLGFVVGTRSNPGIKRQHKPNEDSLFAAQGERSNNANTQPFGLFVVADGMGGHANGQDASRLAIQTIVDRLMPRLSSNEQFTDEAYINLLVEGVQEANVAVHNRNMEHRADMGTTMTAALIVGMTAFVANVGDSRTYLYRQPEGLRKVTNDHSVVASLVEAGIIKPDDIYTHPKRNQIYRSLGEKPMIDVDSFRVPLKPGDKLLLCSDGLWDMVRDPIIQQVLSTVPDPSQTGNALIQAALDGGGEDNVSVIVVHITEASQLSGRPNIQLLARPEEPQYPPM